MKFELKIDNPGKLKPKKRSKKKSAKAKKKKKKKEKQVRVEEVSQAAVSDVTDEIEDLFGIVSSSLEGLEFPEDENDLPDPTKLMEKAIDLNFDTSVFADHEFPKAPNIIEWSRSHDFLSAATDLYPRQFQTLALFFADVCFFCSDVDYVYNVPVDAKINDLLDRFALLQHGVCPICQRNRSEILHEWVVDPKFSIYHDYEEGIRVRPVPHNELCCVWGQRSGKSHMTSTYVDTYQIHRYLSLPNPLQYYNEPGNKIIEGTFVATTLPQVNKALWIPFLQAMEKSVWYKDVVRYFKKEGKRLGTQLYRAAQTYVMFPTKRLILQIAAANSSGLRGGTRILGNIDELGWFGYDEGGKRRSNIKNGTEVFRSVNNSLTTLRSKASMRRKAGDYNAIDAIMVNVSSPSSKWDAIMSRAAMAKQKPRIYYTHHSSFEVNPELDEDEICDEFAGEPERLYRDFYAIPPDAASPFFTDKSLLEDRVYTGDQPEFLFTYSIEDSGDGTGLTVLQPTLKEIRPDKTWPRVLSIDNGEKKNSLALVIGRYLPEIEGLLLEEFVEVAPHDGMSIDLAWAHNEFVLKLLEGFNIPYTVYDRWQSGYSFYDLRMNKGLIAERHSLKWADFQAFKNDLLGENIWVTEPESNISIDEILRLGDLAQRAVHPRTNFLAQVLTVNEFGRQVVKPEFGNDDLFRCAVGCHYIITKYKKDFKNRTKNLGRRRGSEKVGCKRANVLAPGSFNLPRSWYGNVPGRKPDRSRRSSMGLTSSGYPKGR